MAGVTRELLHCPYGGHLRRPMISRNSETHKYRRDGCSSTLYYRTVRNCNRVVIYIFKENTIKLSYQILFRLLVYASSPPPRRTPLCDRKDAFLSSGCCFGDGCFRFRRFKCYSVPRQLCWRKASPNLRLPVCGRQLRSRLLFSNTGGLLPSSPSGCGCRRVAVFTLWVYVLQPVPGPLRMQ